ncbi:MAG: AbrB/MazE/SpoVT family DNA-binding domain-containing protein [Thermoplasmata archaeon]|nr:AbrB/MazE/SpoVT family DNA-binding domain-containing protein [Thermoplasmata archaeon]
MTKLTVRRTGNSLAVPLPRALVRSLGVAEGDVLNVELERVPDLLRLAGTLKGRITADEFTRLSNEGEDID